METLGTSRPTWIFRLFGCAMMSVRPFDVHPSAVAGADPRFFSILQRFSLRMVLFGVLMGRAEFKDTSSTIRLKLGCGPCLRHGAELRGGGLCLFLPERRGRVEEFARRWTVLSL